MKKVNKQRLILTCLSLSLVAGAMGVISVNPIEVKAETLVSDTMLMEKGASLYLNEVSGLKFSYTVSDYDANAEKTYGMLIVPYDYLDDAGITDLTNTANDYVNALETAYEEGKIANAPIVEEVLPNSKGVFSHSISGLKEHNYAREFFGIGFEKTGEDTYVYAMQHEEGNVRSVFEVANLALDKLNYGTWEESSEDEMAEKTLLANNEEEVLNPFITKAFEFVYGTTTPIIQLDAVAVNGETTPVITTQKVKNVELDMHWNYAFEDAGVASFENGKMKGEERGETKITASLGKALSAKATATVLKDVTELELYNNSSKADFFAVDGQISLVGGFYNGSSNNTEKVGTSSGSVGYVAFEDTYTLDERGTYIDIYFTGNNMPSVEFFASEVNAKFMLGTDLDDGKGFIVNNGLAYSSTNNDDSTARFNGWAAYDGYFNYGVSAYNDRWKGADAYKLGVTASTDGKATIYDNKYSTNTTMSYSNFSMYSLARLQDANQNYRYTVGMYKDGEGYVWLDAKLFKVATDGTETEFAAWKGKAIIEGQTNSITQDKLADGETISGKIVLHAAVKGMSKGMTTPDTNVFSCSAPYAGEEPVVLPQHENATFNEDGTVSVKNGSLVSTNDFAKIGTTGYVVLDNDYQLGEYVDIYFTGSNMPNLSFLTKTVEQINANTAGFLLWRGTKWAADSSSYSWQSAGSFLVYSPNRSGTNQDKADMNSKSLGSSTSNASGAQSSGHPLSLYILENYEANTKFKMTIGFYKDSDGYVAMSVDVDTWDESNGTWVTYVAKAGKTSKAYSDFTLTSTIHADNNADKLGTYLIAYGGHDGTETTTFSYSAPYTK